MSQALRSPRARFPALQWRWEIMHLAFAGMEISWITPIFLALVEQARRFPPLVVALLLAAIMVGYYAWSRAAERYQIDVGRERAVMLLTLPLVVLLSWRIFLYPGLRAGDFGWIRTAGYDLVYGGIGGHWFVLLAVLFLWWRGVSLSRRGFSFDSISLAFRAGLLVLIAALLLLGFMSGDQAVGFIFSFFFFSLIAVSLTRLEEVGQIKGEVGRLFDAYWLGLLIGAIVLLLGAGLVLIVVASPAGIEFIRDLWEPIGRALANLLVRILTLLLAPLEPFFQWLASLMQGLPQDFLNYLDNIGDFGDLEVGAQNDPSMSTFLPVAMQAVRLFCSLGLLLGLLLLGLWVLRKERQRRRDQVEEHGQSDQSLRDTLAGLWRDARDRLRNAAAMIGRFGMSSDLLAAISVRNIYANMTRLARRRGYVRRGAQTPYEFLPSLLLAFPQAQSEAEAITDAYVGVHYGELPTSQQELDGLRAAFERLRRSPAPQQEDH